MVLFVISAIVLLLPLKYFHCSITTATPASDDSSAVAVLTFAAATGATKTITASVITTTTCRHDRSAILLPPLLVLLLLLLLLNIFSIFKDIFSLQNPSYSRITASVTKQCQVERDLAAKCSSGSDVKAGSLKNWRKMFLFKGHACGHTGIQETLQELQQCGNTCTNTVFSGYENSEII